MTEAFYFAVIGFEKSSLREGFFSRRSNLYGKDHSHERLLRRSSSQ